MIVGRDSKQTDFIEVIIAYPVPQLQDSLQTIPGFVFCSVHWHQRQRVVTSIGKLETS